jgi:molybdate transport system regulatory protein
VVLAAKGGLQGGGAQVTALGQEALARFRRIQSKASAAIEQDARDFRKLLLS